MQRRDDAKSERAGCADLHRSRLSEFRSQFLVRAVRARRNAKADRRQDRSRRHQGGAQPRRQARLVADGWQPGGGTPAEFTKLWMDTLRQLGHVIQERHITIE